LKKFISFLILIIFFNNNIFSQSSKKVQKRISKLELRINVRGLDITKAIVPLPSAATKVSAIFKPTKRIEYIWADELFAVGFEVGDYDKAATLFSKKGGKSEVNLAPTTTVYGGYLLEITGTGEAGKILDYANNRKIVCSWTAPGMKGGASDDVYFHLVNHILTQIWEKAKTQ